MCARNKKNDIAFRHAGSWYHNIRLIADDGTVKYSKKGGFSTESEAKESYYQYEKKFEADKKKLEVLKQNLISSSISLKSYLEYWFEDIFSARVENTTRMLGAYVLYDLIEPCLEKDVTLKNVNSEYINAILEESSKVTDSAGNKSREFLNMAFKEAVEIGYIRNNPVAGSRKYPRTSKRVTILNKEQIKLLLTEAKKGDWYLEIMLALFCGLRKGEILGLHFSDVDFDAGTISICRQITSNPQIKRGESSVSDYSVIEKQPKTTNSYRILQVPLEVLNELGRRKQQVEVLRKNKSFRSELDYVSCQPDGRPRSLSSMNIALNKLCKRNGLPHISPHGLRHNYATILLENGVELPKISALLGHSSVNTTFEYYCEVMDDEKKIQKFMNDTFKPKETI